MENLSKEQNCGGGGKEVLRFHSDILQKIANKKLKLFIRKRRFMFQDIFLFLNYLFLAKLDVKIYSKLLLSI